MKKIIGLILLSTMLVSCATTKIYIVRHAEKNSTKPDADLKTPEGYTRANELKKVLEKVKLNNVFSTNTTRTIHTVEPTAYAKSKPLEIYKNGDSLALKLLTQKNKRFLICGHSNTVPQLIKAVGLNSGIEGNIADNDFDNLFIITKKWRFGKVKLSLEKRIYGVETN